MLLTVRNVGRILDLFDAEHSDYGPTQVANELEMSRSKAHLLLASMTEIGLLRRAEGGRYCIGWRALSLERLVTGSAPFRPLARAMALRLARHTSELVHVAALDQGRVVYIDRVAGANAVKIALSEVGATLPAHCSGVGKTLLAYLGAGEIELILDRHGMPRLTDRTIGDRDALYAELHRVRRDGVALDREEVQRGLSCAAAPIFDGDGTVVAAISLSVPTPRFTRNEDAFRTMIVNAAAGVSRQLRATHIDELPPVSY